MEMEGVKREGDVNIIYCYSDKQSNEIISELLYIISFLIYPVNMEL